MNKQWTDEKVESIISMILKCGVIIASVVMLIGAAVYLSHHGMETPNWKVFNGEPADLRTIPGTVTDALALHGRGLLQLGALLLMATPLVRVGFSVFAFFMQRDRLYMCITLVVLSVLIYSLSGVL